MLLEWGTPMNPSPFKCILFSALLSGCALLPGSAGLGVFGGQSDIGKVSRPGTASFDAASGSYTVGSSGANMWFAEDDMHYVWKQVSGDVSIAADVATMCISSSSSDGAITTIPGRQPR